MKNIQGKDFIALSMMDRLGFSTPSSDHSSLLRISLIKDGLTPCEINGRKLVVILCSFSVVVF